jgi:AcrR family transcriptional regulator
MNSPAPVKRRYRSTLRAAQAKATRRAILESAARLFIDQGYVATSMDAVAAAAGVSRATVFASVGGKKALLKHTYDVALVGDDEPIPFPDRPRSQEVRREPDAWRLLERYTALIVEMYERLAPIYEAVRGAASADPEVRDVWETIGAERRVGSDNLIASLQFRGSLRDGLDATTAADLMWVLNDPGLYHLLVNRRGWTPARFEAWLGRTMQEQLLPDRPLPSG